MSSSIFTDAEGGLMDNSLGKKISGKVDSQTGKDSLCPSMSLKHRIIGFAICSSLGLFITLLSFGALFVVVSGEMWRFAVPYTIGTVLSLMGSMFLCGPWKQIKSMFARKRIIVTLVLLSSIVATLVFAFALQSDETADAIVVLLCILVEYCAFFWYSLSYIPFGREIFCKCFKNCLKIK